MSLILHITTAPAWEAAQQTGQYTAPSLETQGFIHFSTEVQVLRVADTVFRGQPDLVLLYVEPSQLRAELRYEPPELAGGPDAAMSERFPHLYGPLNLDAVVRVADFPPGPDGSFSLPK